MSKIVFRLPSKAVQYGYVEMDVSFADLGFESLTDFDPAMVGEWYAKWVIAFKQGEQAAVNAAKEPDPLLKPDTSLAERNLKAQPMPDERDFGSEQEAEEAIKSTLGATVVESDAPWNNKTTPTAPKPWEKKKATGDLFA